MHPRTRSMGLLTATMALAGMALATAALATAALAMPADVREAELESKLSGRIAYLQDGRAWIHAEHSRTVGLPHSKGAQTVSLSPTDGTVLYFVQKVGAKPEDTKTLGYVSRSPYTEATPLPSPFDTNQADVVWQPNGARAYLNGSIDGATVSGYCTPATGQFTKLEIPVASSSADGSVLAYSTAKETRVRYASGEDKLAFSMGKPEGLFAALKAARFPKRLKDLTSEIDPTLWHDSNQWSVSDPVLMLDGKRLFFATNAGTGQGAQGNCTWCFIAADPLTGKLYPLSKTGADFSRVPWLMHLSPDGKRLLYATSVHGSAIENPCSVYVLDLLSQSTREYLWAGHDADKETSLVDGICWSPDSRTIAVSSYFYTEDEALKKPEGWEPSGKDYRLDILDVASGMNLDSIEGATEPSWGK